MTQPGANALRTRLPGWRRPGAAGGSARAVNKHAASERLFVYDRSIVTDINIYIHTFTCINRHIDIDIYKVYMYMYIVCLHDT